MDKERFVQDRSAERFAHRALCRAFDWVMEALPESSARVESGVRVHVSRPLPFDLFCGVWLTDDRGDAEIAGRLPALVGSVEALGLPAGVFMPARGFPASALAARRLGITEVEPSEMMLLDSVQGVTAAPEDVPGFAIEPARSASELDQALTVAARGFGVPDSALAALYAPSLCAGGQLTTYVGRLSGTAVSTGAGLFHDDLVGVYNVATPPEYRRRGYAVAIVRRIVTDGFIAGARAAYLLASQDGLGVYRRVGFRPAGRHRLFSRPGEPAGG